MASGPSSSTIEKDWQEIDDAGSVHSLSSTSDGELVEHPDNDDDTDMVDLGRSNTTLRTPFPHNPSATPDETNKESSDSPRVGRRISISSLIHEREADRVPSPPPDPVRFMDKEGSPNSQSSEDSFATQQDVEAFSNRFTQLSRFLNEIERETSGHMERHISFRIPVLYKLHDTIRMLQQQLDEVCPIVKACAEHLIKQNQTMYMDPADLPLNGNLPQWSDELRTRLLGFQVQMDAQVSKDGSYAGFSPTPASPVSGFSKSADDLESLRLAMAEFLPLIKSDYGEFRTKHMSIPTSATPVPGRRRSGGVDPTIAALRQAFYGMRDEISKILDLIVEIHTSNLRSPITKDAPTAIKSLSDLRHAVMLILTNNPSEWIDSDLDAKRKILSYPAFIALSPEVLQDVTLSLKEVRDDLDVPVDKDNTQRMIYKHQIVVLTHGGKLQEIQSTVNFLESLLIPGAENETTT